jgi:hypothetical protein
MAAGEMVKARPHMSVMRASKNAWKKLCACLQNAFIIVCAPTFHDGEAAEVSKHFVCGHHRISHGILMVRKGNFKAWSHMWELHAQ